MTGLPLGSEITCFRFHFCDKIPVERAHVSLCSDSDDEPRAFFGDGLFRFFTSSPVRVM